MERDGVFAVALSGPFCRYDAVAEALAERWCVRTIGAMDFDAAVDRDKAEDIVAIDWVAAACHLEVDAFEVTVDDENVVRRRRCLVLLFLHRKFACASRGGAFGQSLFAFCKLLVALNEGVGVKAFFGDGFVEFRRLFVARLFD